MSLRCSDTQLLVFPLLTLAESHLHAGPGGYGWEGPSVTHCGGCSLANEGGGTSGVLCKVPRCSETGQGQRGRRVKCSSPRTAGPWGTLQGVGRAMGDLEPPGVSRRR